MKKILFVNITALVISLAVLFFTLELKPDIESRSTILEQMHEVESASATDERRQEASRNVLIDADSRLDRAAAVTKACLVLCAVSCFATLLNSIYIGRKCRNIKK